MIYKLEHLDKLTNQYIFIVNDVEDVSGRRIDARLLAKRRLSRSCWPLYANTNHRLAIKKGDIGLIYLAGKGELAQNFFAHTTIKEVVAVSKEYADLDGLNVLSTPPASLVLFETIDLLEPVTPIKILLDHLSFIPQNRMKWGAAMQTGCRKINKEDYEYIISSSVAGI